MLKAPGFPRLILIAIVVSIAMMGWPRSPRIPDPMAAYELAQFLGQTWWQIREDYGEGDITNEFMDHYSGAGLTIHYNPRGIVNRAELVRPESGNFIMLGISGVALGDSRELCVEGLGEPGWSSDGALRWSRGYLAEIQFKDGEAIKLTAASPKSPSPPAPY